MMQKFFKVIAVFCALSVALLTGSLYVRSIKDDIRSQDQLNERLQKLCDQARQTNWNDHSQAIVMTKLPKSHALNVSIH